MIALGAYVWVLTGWLPIRSTGAALAVGCAWLAMTVAFEFGFGRFVAK